MSAAFPVAAPGALERNPEACRERNDLCFALELQRAQNGRPSLPEQPRARPDCILKALEEGRSRVRKYIHILPVVPADDIICTHLLRERGREAVEDADSHRTVGRRQAL